MTTVIPRESAVRRIAAHIADRDAFIVVVPPGLLDTLAAGLVDVPDWTGYADNGTRMVLRTDQPGALLVVEAVSVATAVVIVPKTVPAGVLAEALGQEIPADGSQDLVLLHEDERGPLIWPRLFVDALEIVDPAVAAHLHANDLAGLS